MRVPSEQTEEQEQDSHSNPKAKISKNYLTKERLAKLFRSSQGDLVYPVVQYCASVSLSIRCW